VVHDIEVPNSGARRQIAIPREVFVPPLDCHAGNFSDKKPAQFGPDAIQDAFSLDPPNAFSCRNA